MTVQVFVSSTWAVEKLLDALKDRNATVRFHAAEALSRITPGVEWAIDVLLDALEDKDDELRERSITALGRIGSERAVEELLTSLVDEKRDVQEDAAEALEGIKLERLAKGLLSAMSHENSFVRKKAATVIGYYSDKPAGEELKHLATNDPDPGAAGRYGFARPVAMESAVFRPERGR